MKNGGTNIDDAFLADQEAIFKQLDAEGTGDTDLRLNDRCVHEQQTRHADEKGAQSGDDIPNTDTEDQAQHQQTRAKAHSPDAVAALPQHDRGDPHEDREPLEKKEDGWGSDVLEASSTISTKDEPPPNDDEDDSIIAYWKWENTWKTQQIKMHLAAGSDLALHVVVAIIANQVRYERNAIAMTVQLLLYNIRLREGSSAANKLIHSFLT